MASGRTWMDAYMEESPSDREDAGPKGEKAEKEKKDKKEKKAKKEKKKKKKKEKASTEEEHESAEEAEPEAAGGELAQLAMLATRQEKNRRILEAQEEAKAKGVGVVTLLRDKAKRASGREGALASQGEPVEDPLSPEALASNASLFYPSSPGMHDPAFWRDNKAAIDQAPFPPLPPSLPSPCAR